ncbi:Protein mmf1 [Penicillium macrosclerotiorum]|uniref:Protein mmf1 n=1 Tax=Penicillium macrosclerotiorum TaxID=303699 RepID=UPI002547CBD1|nr:Protein mmf1 [Penicillium macrosclerotiorum]KAJ5698221.1 Protein mmf1 [Penicillium macrosclerotiorum]
MLRTVFRLQALTRTLNPRLTTLSRPQFITPIMSANMTSVTAKDACPPAGPYSQAIRANGQIFVSGQIPADATGTLVQGNIGELTQACCNNIQAILTAAGSSVSKIVKVNVFLTDMANFAEMNATYEKFFVHKPARSCVAVHQLPKGVPVEIECIALE